MPRLHLTPGQDLVPIVQEAGWASGPVWTGAENLTPTGILSPDRPARRQLIIAGIRIQYLLYIPGCHSTDITCLSISTIHY